MSFTNHIKRRYLRKVLRIVFLGIDRFLEITLAEDNSLYHQIFEGQLQGNSQHIFFSCFDKISKISLEYIDILNHFTQI